MRYTLRPCKRRDAALYVGRMALVTALIVAALSCCAFAANGIMLQINDAPLKQVVMMLMQQSGTNIVIADESKLEKKITANLSDVPLEKALDYIVRGAGVSYKKMDDGTYIIGGSMSEATPIVLPNVIPDALPAVETTAQAPRNRIWTTIKLTYSKPSELLNLVGWDGVNPMPNCEALYPDRRKPSPMKITSGGGGMNVQTSNNGDMNPVDGNGNLRPNTQPAIPTMDPIALNTGAGRTASPYDGAGQVPGPNPYRGPTSTNTTNTPQQRTTNTSNSQNLLWPDGIDQAVPFDLDNSIIVKGDEQGIQDFKNIIRMLDVPPKQVSIKAEFIEVKTTDVKRFGIDWSLDRLNESFSATLAGGGNVVAGFATGNLTAALRTQLTSDIGTIINSPIISTINNQNAYISINSQIPYWTTYNTITGTGTVIQQSTPNFIEIDTHLDVLPRVNGDGTITMTLRPGVADTGNIVSGPDNTEIPEQRNQELFTQRRVANGETIVLGGFIRKNNSSSVTKIPILGDLPIVGSLFRGVAKTTEDRELLIFITPTIIPDSTSGTMGVGGGNLIP